MDGGLGQSPGCGDAGVAQWGAGQGLIEDLWRSVYLDRAGTLWLAGVQHVMALPSGAAHLIDRSIPGSDSESVYGHFPLIEDREGRIIVPSDMELYAGMVAAGSILARPAALSGAPIFRAWSSMRPATFGWPAGKRPLHLGRL